MGVVTRLLLIAVVVTLGALPPGEALGENSGRRDSRSAMENKPPAAAVAAWERMRTVKRENAPKDEGDDPLEYWAEVAPIVFYELYELAQAPGARENLGYFVRQFGKHGPDADLRWLLAEIPCAFSPRSYRPKAKPEWRKLQLLFAELQVRRFLKNPRVMERYYHSVVWFGLFFHELGLPVRIGEMERGFRDRAKGNYWWHARAFLLLAHATGRDDLVKGADPQKLDERFEQWYAWFKKEGMYLRASDDSPTWKLDEGEKERREAYLPFVTRPFTLPPLKCVPKHPLPDWKGPAPGTPREFREMT